MDGGDQVGVGGAALAKGSTEYGRLTGTYCYKPDMRKTCCPQYAIRYSYFDSQLRALRILTLTRPED